MLMYQSSDFMRVSSARNRAVKITQAVRFRKYTQLTKDCSSINGWRVLRHLGKTHASEGPDYATGNPTFWKKMVWPLLTTWHPEEQNVFLLPTSGDECFKWKVLTLVSLTVTGKREFALFWQNMQNNEAHQKEMDEEGETKPRHSKRNVTALEIYFL